MQIVLPSLGIGHVDDPALQPAEQVDALLAVSRSRILQRDDGMLEDRIAALKSSPCWRRLISRFRASQVTTQ